MKSTSTFLMLYIQAHISPHPFTHQQQQETLTALLKIESELAWTSQKFLYRFHHLNRLISLKGPFVTFVFDLSTLMFFPLLNGYVHRIILHQNINQTKADSTLIHIYFLIEAESQALFIKPTVVYSKSH